MSVIVAAYRHMFSPRENAEASRRLSELLAAPALGALTRSWQRTGDRERGHSPRSQQVLFESLQKQGLHGIGLDSGRTGELTAGASIGLGTPNTPDATVVAPLRSHIMVPYDPEGRDALVEVLVDVADALRVVWGMITVEPSLDDAHRAALEQGPRNDDRARHPLLTDERIRYRRMPWWFDTKLDRSIGGPEWGTILGPGHVARLDLGVVRASGAFAEVRPLPYGGAFLRLSGDPSDAQQPEILDLVAAGRAALAPIMIDVSAVPL